MLICPLSIKFASPPYPPSHRPKLPESVEEKYFLPFSASTWQFRKYLTDKYIQLANLRATVGIVQSHAFKSRRMYSPRIGYLKDYYRKGNVACLTKTSLGHEHHSTLFLATTPRCSLKICCWCRVTGITNQHLQSSRAMLPWGALPSGDNSTHYTEIYISIPVGSVI